MAGSAVGLALALAAGGLVGSLLSREATRSDLLLASETTDAAAALRRWTVCTFNVRGFFDHYPRRKRLLRKTLEGLQPDVLALQEVMVNGAGQDDFCLKCLSAGLGPGLEYTKASEASILAYLRACGAPPSYGPVVAVLLRAIIETQDMLFKVPVLGAILARAPRYLEVPRHWLHALLGIDILHAYFPLYAPIWGLSTIVSPHITVDAVESIPLRTDLYAEHLATAHRAKLTFPASSPSGKPHSLWILNVHLDSTTAPEGSSIRAAEVRLILDWMRPVLDQVTAVLAVGDNNTLLEHEHLFDLWRGAGFESAHLAVHGHEPATTWPSGIACSPFIDVDGNPGCLDYIWVYNSERLVLHDAGVAGTEACLRDPELFASDHFALWTQFSFR